LPNREIDREGITATYAVIRKHIRRTPVTEVDAAEFGLPPARLFFKFELQQHSGSFKARGAMANMLLRDVPAAGVVAASGGNHGAAVAYAAQQAGKPAHIFIPTVASPAKIDRIRSYGAELVITGERYADALAACEVWTAQNGAMPIHAYDQVETLLGAGTTGLEFEEQCPELDSMLIAVGGGGLLGGIAAWYAGRIKIIGVEPEAAPTLTYAVKAGKPVDAPAGGLAADSLAPRQVGEMMFRIAQKHMHSVLLVKDEDIVAAQKALWEKMRVVAEPGGAAAFAALLSGAYRPEPGERIGVMVCGANTTAVDFDRNLKS